MKYPMTPMDFALAGLGMWRKQAQSAAMMAMRMAPLPGEAMSNPAVAVWDEFSVTQAEWAKASRSLSLAMLDAASAPDRRR